MRCGDSECDLRSDSERCFGRCAWRERLIITHAIPEQHENTFAFVKPNTMIATMNAHIEGLLPLP